MNNCGCSTRITPRDALQLTWSIAEAEAERQGIKSPQFEPAVYFQRYPPARWNVAYWLGSTVEQDGGTPAPTPDPLDLGNLFNLDARQTGLLMGVDVDAITGKILNTDYFWEPDSTPTASPTSP